MSENTDNTDNAKIILDAGAALTAAQFPPSTDWSSHRIPFVVVPHYYQVKDIEHLQESPARKRGKPVMLDASSFIQYIKKHGNQDETVIYADVDYQASKYGLVGIINDHGTETPSWRDHKLTLTPLQSLEWKRWTGANGTQMPQELFAAFLEDNIGDIATVDGMPNGTQMLEMALAFEANSDKRFKKHIDLQGGGAHLEYVDKADEETSVKMRLFERFTIGIPVFQGATEGYPIEARLKFRTNNGELKFWYELVRPDRVFKTAVSAEIAKIFAATEFMVLFGTP